MASVPKRRRLTDIAGKKYVTARALAEILKNVADDGLPDTMSASSVARRRQAICYKKTPYGPVIFTRKLPLRNGGVATVQFQQPYAMLHALLESSLEFRRLFTKVCEANDFHLGVVLYTDEVTPGNALSPANKRKVQAIYWSIMQFLYPVLANDAAWFTGFTGRSFDVNFIDCQLSCVVSDFLKLFFDKTGHSGRNGIMLPLGETKTGRLVFFELVGLIEDERAHKAVLMNKGATGCKSCWLCINSCKPDCRFLPDITGYMVSHFDMSRNKFKPMTIDMLRRMVKRLAEVSASGDTALLDNLEIQYGVLHGPYGVVAEHGDEIDFLAVFMLDWFHCELESGVTSEEIAQCMTELTPHGLGPTVLHEFLKKFAWPRGYSGAANVCVKGRVIATGS